MLLIAVHLVLVQNVQKNTNRTDSCSIPMSVSLLGKSRCVQTGSETSASDDSGDFLGIFRDIGIYMCKQMIDLTAPDRY
jgi:hypothetical protein